MRYGQDLTPWRSVEGESNGPLDSWFLLAAHDLGMPFSYPTLHLLAALCLVGILLATHSAARRLAGDAAALVGLAAGAWWLAWAPVQEFEHYSSELVPCLLLSCSLSAVIRARQTPSGADWRLGLLGGALLGLAPWGKLQAAPLALALGVWAVGDGLFEKSAPAPVRWRYAAALAAGAILPGVLLLTWVVRAGAGEEFWRPHRPALRAGTSAIPEGSRVPAAGFSLVLRCCPPRDRRALSPPSVHRPMVFTAPAAVRPRPARRRNVRYAAADHPVGSLCDFLPARLGAVRGRGREKPAAKPIRSPADPVLL